MNEPNSKSATADQKQRIVDYANAKGIEVFWTDSHDGSGVGMLLVDPSKLPSELTDGIRFFQP